MNVFSVSFSGGECTLHPDFIDIYSYAYEKGFSLSLITNGSAITDEILKMFCKYPPKQVSITMYGDSPEKYELVCGKAEYYDRVVNNIKALKENRIETLLQITVSKDNIDCIEPISEFAKELDIVFEAYTDFTNFRRCDDKIIDENTPDKKEFKKAARKALERTFEIVKNNNADIPKERNEKYIPQFTPIIEKGIQCGTGRSSCAFNYKGQMQFCPTFDAKIINTEGRKISDCWKELVEFADNVPCLVECQNCIFKTQCRSCVARHYNDTHEFGKPSPRLCYKVQYPEKAKKIEEFYKENGYILNSMYDD